MNLDLHPVGYRLFNQLHRPRGALGICATAYLVSELGWRGAFFGAGLLGFVWLMFWSLVFRQPEEATFIGEAERTKILSERGGKAIPGKSAPMLALLKCKSMWGLFVTQGCAVYTVSLFLTWLPSYLHATRGLNALEDKDAIRELLAEYCFLLDSYQLKEFGQLFVEGGERVSRNGNATGPAAIEKFMRQLVPEPGPGTRRKHFTANIIIRLNGDQAEVTSNFLVVRDTSAGPAIAVAGTYHDVVVKSGANWRFKSRRLTHDIVGESGLKPAGS